MRGWWRWAKAQTSSETWYNGKGVCRQTPTLLPVGHWVPLSQYIWVTCELYTTHKLTAKPQKCVHDGQMIRYSATGFKIPQ